MSLNLGTITTIVVSSPAMAQQVLQKHDGVFCNRWVPDAFRGINHHLLSMACMPPNLPWRTVRKISNAHAFSNRSLDGTKHLRHRKLKELVSYIRQCSAAGGLVNLGQAMFSTSLGILSNTFFSMDLAELDSTFNHDFKQNMAQIVYEAGRLNLGDYFPVVRGLDLHRIRHRTGKCIEKMSTLFENIIGQRLANKGFDPSAEVSDVLDAFLKKREEDGVDKLDTPFITHTVVDLFAGGTETSSSTLEWAMTELLRDRSKLTKAQEELQLVLGKGNMVKEEDIVRLPYLQAIVKETFRLHPPLPFLLPRQAGLDVEFCGFNFPKGSQVLINVWAIGRDPSVWERANFFEPERFLELDIDVKGLHFELTPFGSGRRICPGLPLALKILHTTLGSLISSFDWNLEEGVSPEDINVDEKLGIAIKKLKPLLAIPVAI